MVVEDVVYENVDGDHSCVSEKVFRRLIFKRSSGLVQSEALLISNSPSDESDNKNKNSSTASKKKSQKKGLTGIFLFVVNLVCNILWWCGCFHISAPINVIVQLVFADAITQI